MQKLISLFVIIFLFSCKKESLVDKGDNKTEDKVITPTPSTIRLEYNSFFYELLYCRFTYYDVNGVYHYNELDADLKVDSVDFSKPFKAEAQAGLLFGPTPGPYSMQWQTKKDEYVVDVRTATTYVYQN